MILEGTDPHAISMLSAAGKTRPPLRRKKRGMRRAVAVAVVVCVVSER